ncbi:putative alcohol dehydrogenase [Paratrimastix pyriformis]|uniref:Alcohol dehydrogenase n=1 Tax=Paratrimastix pyriformis TaxID=342808 RepID=A0ABQ8UKW2_9EUKA|nr:putative alcohol dehydrogenase [Paratrimastix pyriformis]
MQFDLRVPRIIFGRGSLTKIGDLCREYGSSGSAIVITGKTISRATVIFDVLQHHHINYANYPVTGEPSINDVEEALEIARRVMATFVIAIGGGSSLDLGKAVSGLLTNEGTLMDYVEIYGRGQKLTRPGAPLICIPTTAGTGTEVTKNAVLSLPEHKVKVSIRSELLVPSVAIIDPLLTTGLPPTITANSGMDALTQCIEPYTSCSPVALVDTLCLDGVRRAADSLKRAYDHPDDLEARENMCLASCAGLYPADPTLPVVLYTPLRPPPAGSLYGGLGLSNAKLGAVHGFAGTLGGITGAPHGAICGTLLPFVMRANVAKLRRMVASASASDPATVLPSTVAQRAVEDHLARYTEVARIVTGRPDAQPEDGVEWILDLARNQLRIPSLRKMGVTGEEEQLQQIIQGSAKASSMKGNCIPLTAEELKTIIIEAL